MAEVIRGRTGFKPRSVSHSRAASLRPVFCTAGGLVLGSLASGDRDSVGKPQELGWGQREAEMLVERLTLGDTGRPAHAGLCFSGRLQGPRGANGAYRPGTPATLEMAGNGGAGFLQGGEAPFAGKCLSWAPPGQAASWPRSTPCQPEGREPQKANAWP